MPYIPMIDTLIAFIDIKEYEETAQDILNLLQDKKNKAKTMLTDNSSEIVTVQIDDMTFEVLSNGKRGYAYILHNELYELDFAQYRSKNKDFYPICIKVKSECLWYMNPFKAWEYICKWITANVGEILENKISRIDLCCHTDEFFLTSEDSEKFKGQYYIENSYKYRRKVSAMYFGSSATGKVYCRIYDKVLEVTQKKNKTWFFDVWEQNGLNKDNVWNVEFQINREYLKDNCINTVEEAFERLRSIWEYCTCFWIVKIVLDNERITRCSIDNKWAEIQKVFNEFKCLPLVKREKQISADADAMIPSLYGTFTSWAGRKGTSDLKLALNMMEMSGRRYLNSKKLDFQEVVKIKQSLLDKKPCPLMNGIELPESAIMVGDKTVFEL
ncbi:MAG TPA: hypothetical protein PLL98_12070 [Bacillota bacterium]|nr:hypothetical protein [Bacillota bacterium]HPL54835.1 hypothetical protein [Bacillota bacterium]